MNKTSKPLRVLISGGGTGGHVYPAIAIADALRDSDTPVEIAFAGSRDKMEWIAVPKAGYPIKNIWISGIQRRFTLQNLLVPVKLATSITQSWKIINEFKPDAVVCTGGYVCGPVGWVAARKRIPLFLQEQNSYPGVTIRMLAKNSTVIYTAFEAASQYLDDEKIVLCGNPTRKQLMTPAGDEAYHSYGFDPKKPTILVLGGSGGAKAINDAIAENLAELHDEMGMQIIWQCGSKYIESVQSLLDPNKFQNLRLFHFIDNMRYAYSAADIVISRAGASICSELLITGKPSLLVPSPHVAGDHQTHNAMAMKTGGASMVLTDREVNQKLPQTIREMFSDADRLELMSISAKQMARPDAAESIAKDIIQFITQTKTVTA